MSGDGGFSAAVRAVAIDHARRHGLSGEPMWRVYDLGGAAIFPGTLTAFIRLTLSGNLPKLVFVSDRTSFAFLATGCWSHRLPNETRVPSVNTTPYGDAETWTSDALSDAEAFVIFDANDPSEIIVLRNYCCP